MVKEQFFRLTYISKADDSVLFRKVRDLRSLMYFSILRLFNPCVKMRKITRIRYSILTLVWVSGGCPIQAVPITPATLDFWENSLTKTMLGDSSHFPIATWRANIATQQRNPSFISHFLATYKDRKGNEYLRLRVENYDTICAYGAIGISPKQVHTYWKTHVECRICRPMMAAVLTAQWYSGLTIDTYRPGEFNPHKMRKDKSLSLIPSPCNIADEATISNLARSSHFKDLALACFETMYGSPPGHSRSEAFFVTSRFMDRKSPIDLVAHAGEHSLQIYAFDKDEGRLALAHQYTHNHKGMEAPVRCVFLENPDTAAHLDRLVPFTSGMRDMLARVSTIGQFVERPRPPVRSFHVGFRADKENSIFGLDMIPFHPPREAYPLLESNFAS